MNEIEEGKEFWQEQDYQNQSSTLISILFNLASISKEEIKQLIDRALRKEKSYFGYSFYDDVIKQCLSSLRNQRLIKEFPELIIETAWKNWKYIPPKKSQSDIIPSFTSEYLCDEECWGIRDNHSFSPSGIYKTPAYTLLWEHPILGLKFLINFINYSVEFYVNATCKYKHKISDIEIELNDGTIVKKYGAWELWAAYRGLSVTNYLLESLLMSLEKFLLETAKRKSEVSKENLKYIFDYVLKNSNNVAPLGVLTSVAIAHPEEVEESMLPLLSAREFYEWDISRALREHSAFAPMDNRIAFAQKERWESNQLPHRTKYYRGLSSFIVYYQFNIGKFNPQIHNLFDKLKSKAKEDDWIWKKQLNEIDRRNWEAQPYDEKLGGFVVKPKYEQEIVERLAENQEYFENQDKLMGCYRLISNAYENKEAISLEKWSECFQYYSNTEHLDTTFTKPVSLAILGLREFCTVLSEEQKNWCMETITSAIDSILRDTVSINFSLDRSVNVMEKEIALSSFHLLMQNMNTEEEKNEIVVMMISMLFAPFPLQEINAIIKYVREVFFKQFPNETKRVWLGLIKYSIYRKNNGFSNKFSNNVNQKETKFLCCIASSKNVKFNFSEISIDNCEGYLLARAFAITPYNTADKDFTDFIKHFLPILTEDLKNKESYSYQPNKGERQIYYESVFSVEIYLTELLLKANNGLAKSVLDLILDPINRNKSLNVRGQVEFSSKLLKQVIRKLDEIISDSNDEEFNQKLISNFWVLWEYLFEKIKKSDKKYFLPTLFLDIGWNETATHWIPFENKKDFYQAIVEEFGQTEIESILNVFSTIGEKTFLPDSISWLVEIFKSERRTALALIDPSAERLIKRLFYNHISKMKNYKTLVADYIWILDEMIAQGSSLAYLFRENVITYKKVL